MIRVAILVVLCFVTVHAAGAGTSNKEHTETYGEWKRGEFTKTFFLPETFLHEHRCTRLSDNSTARMQ